MISMSNVLKTFYSNWKKIFIVSILLSIVFGGLEYRQYYISKGTEQENEEIQDYEEKLKTYEKEIENIKNSIKITQEQVNDIQEYCDQSLYMKIDSQNVHVAAIR